MSDSERGLLDLLTAYLLKEKSLQDCTEWFASLEWAELPLIGNLELLAHEAGEGLRPESDFWEEAIIIVQSLLSKTTTDA